MHVKSKTGSPDVGKLLLKTKFHPKGRVQIDENGEVKNPKTLTSEMVKIKVPNDQGIMQEIEVPRQTGHATIDGIWRSAFSQKEMDLGFARIKGDSPPALYHEMKLASQRRAILKKDSQFLPELTEGEMKSYFTWAKENKKVLSELELEQASALGV